MSENLYLKFNKLVWRKWLESSKGSKYFITNYTEEDHKECLKLLNCDQDSLIESTNDFGRYYWNGFLQPVDGMQVCFGIIALQILAATEMNGREYRDGLCRLLRITLAHLMEAFDWSQHDIWNTFRLEVQKFGFKTSVVRLSGPWCFVRYPIFHSYLNKSDLESIVSFLMEKSQSFEIDKLHYKDFIDIFQLKKKYLYENRVTRRFKKFLSEDRYSDEVLFRQIYQRYLILSPADFQNAASFNKAKRKLFFSKYEGFFYLENEDLINLETKDLRSQLKKLGFKLSKPLIFTYDNHMMEYEQVHRYEEGDRLLIVFMERMGVYYDLTNFLKCDNYHGLYLFYVSDTSTIELFLNEYKSRKGKSIELIGGLKIHRRAFLEGYGPVFCAIEPTMITVGDQVAKLNQNQQLDLSNLSVGYYELSIPDEPKKTFYIKSLDGNGQPIKKNHGIGIKDFSYDGTDLFGQEITLHPINDRIEPLPRTYIDIILNKKEIQHPSGNILLDNLIRNYK